MIIRSISGLKQLLNSGFHKICILDNNSIAFLSKMEIHVAIESIFSVYDLVLIPEWVRAEIEDSESRKNYVDKIVQLSSVSFYYINELDYLELINNRDADLFRIFSNTCSAIQPLNGFIRRNILKGRPIEDLDDYDTWLNILYRDGFEGQILTSGRVRRKNAGEISICVLSLILSYFYIDEVDNITIYSNDSDAYSINKHAISKMQDETCYKNIEYRAITFKSDDFLIYEFYNKFGLQEILNDIHRLRNERWIRFARKKSDNSIEERYKLVKNDEFLEIIQDNSLYIIF
jgi:hypothetical protein